MLALNREFVQGFSGVGVILSPRACEEPAQLESHARWVYAQNAPLLFDPQFYEPRTNHPKILAYEYWDELDFSTTDFDPSAFCQGVVNYQVSTLRVDEIILPGRYTNSADEAWLELQARIAQAGADCECGLPTYMTVAIGPDVVTSESTFNTLVDEVINYPVDGIYLLVRHPRDHFLVQDELYLYSLLNACLSIARTGKKMIIGYSNQQSLIFAAAGVNAIASGNFRNVRHFNPEMFSIQETDAIQRALWYYDPGTLGEYRIEQLALPYRRGLSGRFGPACEYCRPMLSSENPSNVPWRESEAFRHFLYELRRQWLSLSSSGPTCAERAAAVSNLFHDAIERTRLLVRDGFAPGDRGFYGPAADATIGAIEAFRQDRATDLALLTAP